MPVFLLVLLAAALAGRPATAQTQGPACGHDLSAPVLARWNEMGGARGALGCPLASESVGSTSPQGSGAREADFATGIIVWHASGSHAGQTFVVTGCIWRLYFQYGGTGGWLGLPTDDPVNTPDGQRQAFEGGRVTYLRAPDTCDAERNEEIALASPPAAVGPQAKTSPLDLFFDPARGDYLSAAAANTVRTALAANYQRVGPEALVFDQPGPGVAPLKLFWSEALGDHLTVATVEGERDALTRGYQFEAAQGFVWSDPHPGALALKQYRNGAHNWLVATPEEESEAKTQGYVFVRVEGYAPAP